jgi:cell division protein FtsX
MRIVDSQQQLVIGCAGDEINYCGSEVPLLRTQMGGQDDEGAAPVSVLLEDETVETGQEWQQRARAMKLTTQATLMEIALGVSLIIIVCAVVGWTIRGVQYVNSLEHRIEVLEQKK